MTTSPFLPLEPADYQLFEAAASTVERLRGQTLLITGGTGFVGSWLLEALLHLNRQHTLRLQLYVLTRNPQRFAATRPHLALDPAVHVTQGDILSPAHWTQDMPPIDLCIHGAFDSGLTPGTLSSLQILNTILDGTRNVLTAAAALQTRRVLFISSGAVYGDMPAGMDKFKETTRSGPDQLSPRGAYAEGKRAAEAWGLAYCEHHQIEFVIARLFAFAGPYLPLDQHFAFGNFLRDSLKAGPIRIQGSGQTVRSYLYGADLAVWLLAILNSDRTGTAWNVGSDQAVTILQLAQLFRDVSGIPGEVEHNAPLDHPQPISVYVPEISKARNELGVDIRVPLPEAIRASLSYYRRAR